MPRRPCCYRRMPGWPPASLPRRVLSSCRFTSREVLKSRGENERRGKKSLGKLHGRALKERREKRVRTPQKPASCCIPPRDANCTTRAAREHGPEPNAWSCSGARTRAAAPQPASQTIEVIGSAAAAMPRSQTGCCPCAKDGQHQLPVRPQRLQRHRDRSIVGPSGGATDQLQQGELGDAAGSVRALRLELPSPEEGDEDVVRQHVRALN